MTAFTSVLMTLTVPLLCWRQKNWASLQSSILRACESVICTIALVFLIDFANFYSTHTEENRKWSEDIYGRLKANNHIASRTITQAFDPEKELFLADRFIKGTCPRCKAEDQYGDNCESCGATYSPSDLIDPVSAISGATPVDKESKHLFFKLPEFETMLKQWLDSDTLQPQVANKLREWTDAGLQEWDISRDAPYFGFEIPGETGEILLRLAGRTDWLHRQL